MLKNSQKFLYGAAAVLLLLLFVFLISAKRQIMVDENYVEMDDYQWDTDDESRIWTEERRIDISPINSIMIEGKISIVVINSEDFVIEIQDETGVNLSYEIRGDELYLKTRRNYKGDLKCRIRIPDLEYMDIEGAVDISLEDLALDALDIKIQGAWNIDTENFSLDELQLQLEGIGNIDMSDLELRKLNVDAEGINNMKFIMRYGEVFGRIEGLGNVDIGGQVVLKDIDRNGIISLNIAE